MASRGSQSWSLFCSNGDIHRDISPSHFELKGLARFYLTESFRVSFRFHPCEGRSVTGHNTIADLETCLLGRQAAPEFPYDIES